MKIGVIVGALYPFRPETVYGYSGVAFDSVEELVKRGHEVTVFCSQKSKTSGKIYDNAPTPIEETLEKARESSISPYAEELYMLHLMQAAKEAKNFDIIQNHDEYRFAILAELIKTPTVTTVHSGGLSKNDLSAYSLMEKNYFVALSRRSRELIKDFPIFGVVYNGINVKNFSFSGRGGDYLAWLGRVDSEKGLIEAIEVSKKADVSFNAAGVLRNEARESFFKYRIKPLLKEKREFIGEVWGKEKSDFLRNAKALLFPISWEEPFGLVMVEAMACGTPVIAFRRGSVPEVVKDGETGFIVEPGDIDAMVEAVKKIYSMPEKDYLKMRRNCRLHVEKFFTVEKMVDGYEKVYKKIIKGN
jgi:glycosyltransferase involved in cell wall biosynthesis